MLIIAIIIGAGIYAIQQMAFIDMKRYKSNSLLFPTVMSMKE